jgi:two-component system, chemotaxis family, sensor kinase CheA
VARLIDKAVAANLVSPAKAAELSAEAALNLIFAPGLSTADNVTAISGRGVGMDVVRANVERLGGAISIDNRPGLGLAITLRAPLTLSIMNALLVESGGRTFAVPRAAIYEIVSVKSPSVRVEAVGGGHVAVVRGRMLSVVSLAAMLNIRDEPLSHLVIVDPPGGNRFAMGVAFVRDHEELVVRPTAPHVAALGVYAGQALPDNGVPVLVIDPAGIAARAGIAEDRQHRTAADVKIAKVAVASLLLFDGLDGQRRAMRAADIARIDDVDAGEFVTQGDKSYVHVDGALMPVVLDGLLPATGRVALLRMAHAGGEAGYPVKEVQDLVPVPDVTPVGDGMVEGFVLIEGKALPLLAWPRVKPEAANRRRRA